MGSEISKMWTISLDDGSRDTTHSYRSLTEM